MMNIATLTLNPTIDVAYTVARFVHTDKLRIPAQRTDPGGGGINVARVFVRLGGNARCIYFSGGPIGIALDALLDLHLLVRDRIAIEGETRISSMIAEKSSGKEFRLVPAGPELREHEWRSCLDRISQTRCDYLVMSGSLPRGVPTDFYARAAKIAHSRGISTVLDTSGEALSQGVAAGGLELIKPNLKEFEELVGQKFSDMAEIGEAAREIAASGKARLVAVTMGERGGILANADGVLAIDAPEVETVSAVGAGDSCLAAIVYCLALGKSDEEAFRYGIAAGTAALISPGTDLAAVDDIERLNAQLAPPTVVSPS